MSEQRNKGKVRADPRQKRSEERTSTYLCDISTYDMLCSRLCIAGKKSGDHIGSQ